MAQKMCLVMMMVLVLVTVECDLKASNIPFSPSPASLLEDEVILPQEGDTTICFRNCTLKCGANMDCMHNCLKNCSY
ncbi:hypothetical protein HID58_008761 [Brassica napus]|uniref:Uncharacterized protein n=2 Tax=Brassica TaxID=3705 RepID=A0A8D9DL74_BRACM|nr:hypothetical protein HID58_008761 [Brassica napus]CAF2119954.1 unnamed protein product [Brassica napus]CAG7879445.1 unnamed protein product [Brassica rapa]